MNNQLPNRRERRKAAKVAGLFGKKESNYNWGNSYRFNNSYNWRIATKQERDFYKHELERTNYSTTKNNSPSSNQWRTNEFNSLEGKSSKSPKNVEAPKP